MYQEGEMNPDLGGQIYVEGSQDYNHHNSASLEVDDVHNVPLNSNEEEMIAMHARQMAMNPGHVQEYENLQESNDLNQDDAMRNHNFAGREYMDPNQYQEQLGHQQIHDQMMNVYHNNHILVQQQQQHIQYDQNHGMNPHSRNAELAHHQQHHQHIQHQLQHQLIPQQQQQQQMRPHSLEDQQPLSAPPRKKTKTQYPWLETQGPACYSERQEQSNVDLTNISKKYKSMRCLYCFKYNPVTPWATMRPRKYEMSSLQDHANSLHHQKAEYAREKALSLNSTNTGVFPSLEDHMQLAQARLDAQEAAAAAAAMAAGPPVIHGPSNNAGSPLPPPESPAGPPPSSHPVMNVPSVNINMNGNNSHSINPSVSLAAAAASASAALAASKSSGKKKRPVMELTKTHATRGTLRPSWLMTEGGLIFSERQLADPDRPATLVRKYQLMLCTACAVHSPRSPWATLKPRKFEARLLAEHEVSAHHQKSVATSNAFPGQSSLSQSLLTQTPLMVAGQNQQNSQSSNQQSPQQQGAQGNAQSQAQQQGQQTQQSQHGQGQGQSAASTLTPVDSYHRQPQLTQQQLQQQHHSAQHSTQQLQHSAQHSSQQLHAQQHQQQQAIAMQQALLQQQQQHHQQQQHQQQQLAAQQAALASQYRPVASSVSADTLSHSQPVALPAGHALQSHALSHSMNNYHQVPLQHNHHSVVYPSNVHEYSHQQSYAGPISAHDAAYGPSNMQQHPHAQLIAAQTQLHYQQQQQQLLEEQEQDQADPHHHEHEQQRFASNNNNMLYDNMVYYEHLNNARDDYDPNSNNEEEDNNDNNNN